MSCPRFSFVLPAYKGRYLAESIKSILAQTVTDFELVIVNDCSPDDIAGIVADNSDARIRYFENERNIGGTDLVAQWNRCLSYASGEYVILATDDDVYEPNFLEAFVPLIEKYPEVGVFRARIMNVDDSGSIKYLDKCYKEYLRQEEFCFHLLQGIQGGIPQNIFNRKMLVSNGGFVSFPLAWGSDDATILMMSKKGIVHSQDYLVKFRWSNINISSDHTLKTASLKFEARLKFCLFVEKEVAKMEFKKTALGNYLKEHIVGNQSQKVIVVRALREVPLRGCLSALNMVRKCELFSVKDIISIIYHRL